MIKLDNNYIENKILNLYLKSLSIKHKIYNTKSKKRDLFLEFWMFIIYLYNLDPNHPFLYNDVDDVLNNRKEFTFEICNNIINIIDLNYINETSSQICDDVVNSFENKYLRKLKLKELEVN